MNKTRQDTMRCNVSPEQFQRLNKASDDFADSLYHLADSVQLVAREWGNMLDALESIASIETNDAQTIEESKQ